jgi:hypothetical protein
MKRLFVLLAALAAISSIVAPSAFAQGGGTNGNLTCSSNIGSTWTEVAGNLNVPAGQTCVFWGHVAKNVTVDGRLKIGGSTVDGNVTVDPTGHLGSFGSTFGHDVNVIGGSFQSGNYGSTIKGTLAISGSTGDPNGGGAVQNGFWSEYGDSYVGSISYTNNAVPLYFQGPFTTHVLGSFTYSGSPALQGDMPDIQGQSNIS